MQQCLETFGYPATEPALFPIKNGNQGHAWREELKAKCNNAVTAVVLLLPGQKGKCTLYDDVKRLLLADLPVPS